MRKQLSYTLIVILAWLGSSFAWSCQVPVFRYALERWNAEQYRLVVMHRNDLPKARYAELIALQTKLESKQADVNISLEVVDLDKISEKARWTLPDVEGMKSDPWLVLLDPKGEPVYASAYSEESLAKVLDSPMRRQWVGEIVKGASVVWIVIEGPNEDENKRVKATLAASLKKAQSDIKVPDGVMQPEDVPNAGDDIDMEDVLRSRIPLKIDFPMMTVSRNDPKEAAFVAMLMHGVPEQVKASGETLVVPLFGRGRMLQALPASRLNEQLVMMGNTYLCGACSCQVKDNNPGIDIVIQEHWQKHLSDGLVVVDREPPPLEGVGDLTSKGGGGEDIHSRPPTESSTAASSGGFVKMLSMIGGGVLALLFIGTLILRRTSQQK